MRITDKIISRNLTGSVQKHLQDMESLSWSASSGKKMRRMSDDAVAASRVLELRSEVRTLARYEKNLNEAVKHLDYVESQLNAANQTLMQARTISVQGASDTTNAQVRQALADDVQTLRERLLDIANARFGDTYIFAGYRSLTPAYDADGRYRGDYGERKAEIGPGGMTLGMNMNGRDVFGGTVRGTEHLTTLRDAAGSALGVRAGDIISFNGDIGGTPIAGTLTVSDATTLNDLAAALQTALRAASIPGSGITVTVKEDGGLRVDNPDTAAFPPSVIINHLQLTVAGAPVFSAAFPFPAAIAGGNDFAETPPLRTDSDAFAVLKDLETALRTDSATGVNDQIERIQTALDRILRARAEIGHRVNKAELSGNHITEMEAVVTRLISDEEDADFVKTLTDLQSVRNVYESSLAMTANIYRTSLLDFIR
jgi:flagellar hook-associated protein 3